MAYRWLITFTIWATLLFSNSPRLRGGLPFTFVTSYLSRLCRWWTVLGSLFSRHSSIFTFSLEYLGVRQPALGPALSRRCGLLRSAVFSLALLSRFLPSRVSPFNTRRSALRLARCENLTTRHYKYLHKVRSALLASASNKNPKQAKPRQT